MEAGKVAVLTGIAAAVGVGLIAMLERRPVANPAVPVKDVDYMRCMRSAAAHAETRNPEAAEHLRELIATLERVPAGDQRDRVAAAMRVLDKRLVCLPAWEWESWRPPGQGYTSKAPVLSRAYPDVSIENQARLVLGQTPVQISGGLTPSEAHQWLKTYSHWSPATWLLQSYNASLPTNERINIHIGDFTTVPMARWIIATWKDHAKRAALLQNRVERGPHGEEIEGRWIDRLDELRPQDLRPSVRETFARAAVRLQREVERSMARKSDPLNVPPRWWRPIKCARLLLTPAELAVEGKIMRHCVATYVPYVKGGQSVIVAIDVRGKRSTAEIDRQTVGVIQHRGVGNIDPPELCKRALQVCLTYWRGQRPPLPRGG